MAIGILYGLDPEFIIFGLLFVIFFVIIQFALLKSLKDKSTSSIIAFCVSLLTVYGLSRTNLDISGLFFNIGISEDIIYTIIPIIILAGLIFIFWKVTMRIIMVISGLILIIASRFVYEKSIILVIGIVFLLIGIILMAVESRRKVRKGYYLRH